MELKKKKKKKKWENYKSLEFQRNVNEDKLDDLLNLK
jgi:hypothetical protein